MTDMTAHQPHARRQKPLRAEYRAYFMAILLVALPVALVSWTTTVLRGAGLPDKGPIGQALSHAREIAPMIFSA
jgi:hypothetical protein